MPRVARCYPVNERDFVRHPKSYRASRQLIPGRKMPKTRIWDHEAIEKNPGAWETPVPDTGMRPRETNTEWRLRSLLRDLQALAAEPETLLQAFSFPGPDYVADDHTKDFGFHVELAELCVKGGLISEDMLERARAVLAKLDEMSGMHNAALW